MKRHPLITFFVLMFAISWGVWLPLAFTLEDSPRPSESNRWLPWLHVIGAFGPCFAALIVTSLVEGVEGLRRLFGRLLLWRVSVGWYAVALLLPAGISLLMTAIHMMFGGNAPDYSNPPIYSMSLPAPLQPHGAWTILVPIFVLQLFTGSSLGEELGWRGFALTRLQRRSSALDASLIMAVVWAVWAQPFFHLQRVQAGAWLTVEDLKDLPALVQKLNQGADPVSRFLAERLSPGLRAMMAAADPLRDAPQLDDVMLAELNQVISEVPMYDEQRFQGIPLSPRTRKLLAGKPSDEVRVRLNRQLLQDAYPGEIGRPLTVYVMPFVLLLIGAIPAQILFAWLFNSTGGSLLLVLLFNNSLKVTDMFLAAPNAGQFVPAAAYWLVTLLVVSAVGARRLALRPAANP
jgi:membrane protease YdiL (CAAX protease family)